MTKIRISQTQGHVLFMLAVWRFQRKESGFVKLEKVKRAIDNAKGSPVDASNFSKGIGTLRKHGLIEQFRSQETGRLWIRLADAGVSKAATIYEKKTGEPLVIKAESDGQLDAFSVIDK